MSLLSQLRTAKTLKAEIKASEKTTRTETIQINLAYVAKSTKDENVGLAAVKKLSDQDALTDIALNAHYGTVRLAAVEKLTNQEVLAYFASNDEEYSVRVEACRKTGHEWDGCMCNRCGDTRDMNHCWVGCVCERCKKSNHDMGEIHGGFKPTCLKCGYVDEDEVARATSWSYI